MLRDSAPTKPELHHSTERVKIPARFRHGKSWAEAGEPAVSERITLFTTLLFWMWLMDAGSSPISVPERPAIHAAREDYPDPSNPILRSVPPERSNAPEPSGLNATSTLISVPHGSQHSLFYHPREKSQMIHPIEQ
ncbi:hypothetical protein BJ508DRAFT_302813 [Ascobolus immersus RN42]|uniref:Uncharacterized protein n=1 Tax=Ascobolus immersus RN42 TaxID=1160509 RepID=A0A3N4IIU2_ASCIM|nr:hypothetical protein BJ508DRAFT_302813 [Ascobolus immersus RN42]